MNDKMTTHTAGPWKLLAVGDGTSRMCPADADGLSLLTIVDEDGGDFAAVYKDADARLIAAAPDMLDALHKAREWLEGWGSAEHQLAVINEAIAKAEGTQS